MALPKFTAGLNTLRSRPVKYTLFTVVLLYVCGVLGRQLNQVTLSGLNISTGFIWLSALFELVTRGLVGLGYHYLLRSLYSPLPLGVSVSISCVSSLGKYFPGKIALIASAAYLLKKFHVKLAVAGIVPILSTLATILISMVLSFSLLGEHSFYTQMAVWAGSIGIIVVLFCCLTMFNHKYRFSLTLARFRFHHSYIGISAMIVCLQCFCAGISTWMVCRAFVPMEISLLPHIVSVTAFSGLMGIIAVFSPAGIGVRDGVYFAILSNSLGAETSALITVFLRVLQTGLDLVTALAGYVYLNRKTS